MLHHSSNPHRCPNPHIYEMERLSNNEDMSLHLLAQYQATQSKFIHSFVCPPLALSVVHSSQMRAQSRSPQTLKTHF